MNGLRRGAPVSQRIASYGASPPVIYSLRLLGILKALVIFSTMALMAFLYLRCTCASLILAASHAPKSFCFCFPRM